MIRKAIWMGKGPAPARGDDFPIVEVAALPAVTPSASTLTASPDAMASSTTPPPTSTSPPVELSSPTPSVPMAPLVSEHPLAPSPAPAVSAPPPPPPPAPPATPPATPTPPAPPAALPVDRSGPDIRITLGDRLYRIRNFEKNVDVGQLKVNVLVTKGENFHVDTLDLYLARPRGVYSRDAAIELGVADDVIKKDLGHILRSLEALQDEQRKTALTSKKKADVEMPPEERDEAMELLRDPELLDRILADFRACGIVGEETNKLVGFLAAVSRNFEDPLAVVIQSSSAAGKSSLMEAILAFIPPEHRVKYSAMTGQSLFYMGSTDLQHKVLAIVEEEGAERASYALKLLQSEGELTIASTGKDPSTGRHVTHEYHVKGPVMIFLTTTAVEIDEELLNRCMVLSVNEDREQTRVIHCVQRERQTLEGQLVRRDASRILKRQQNVQRLLRPLLVANPYAPALTFRDDQTRMRRDHGKYLTLIRTITLLRQYQREVKTIVHQGESVEYIEVTKDDIREANRLAHEVLGRTLDELPPQTRRMLVLLDRWVTAECERLVMVRADFRFLRRDVRALGWAETQARIHLDKLVELEYVVAHRGARGQSFVYELVYDSQGQDGRPFLMGLIDPDDLQAGCGYDRKFAGSGGQFAAPAGGFAGGSRPQSGPFAADSRVPSSGLEPARDPGSNGGSAKNAKNTVLDGPASKSVSYRDVEVVVPVAKVSEEPQ